MFKKHECNATKNGMVTQQKPIKLCFLFYIIFFTSDSFITTIFYKMFVVEHTPKPIAIFTGTFRHRLKFKTIITTNLSYNVVIRLFMVDKKCGLLGLISYDSRNKCKHHIAKPHLYIANYT